MTWSQPLGGNTGKERTVPVEWYAQPPKESENLRFIEQSALKIARENNCDLICVRAVMHNTTGALAPPVTGTNIGPGGRGSGAGNHGSRGQSKYVGSNLAPPTEGSPYTLPNARIVSCSGKMHGRLEKVFVEAPWHYTVEFQKVKGGWLSAHVYTETVYDGRDARGKKKYRHKGLAKLGGPIKQNPQIWDRDRPNHGQKLWYKSVITWYEQ